VDIKKWYSEQTTNIQDDLFKIKPTFNGQ
jgi:hypothetical protein